LGWHLGTAGLFSQLSKLKPIHPTPSPPTPRSILHIHTAVEECEVVKLVSAIDMKTKEQKKVKYVKSGAMCVCRITLEKPLCMELFGDLPSMGRFTLRDEGRTIAIGKVTKLPKNH
jgi:peptide chain release factor subunit 3